MHTNAMRVLNYWGALHLGVVVSGLIATVGVGAQNPPSRNRVPGNPQETVQFMRHCYDELQSNDWRVSGSALRYAYVPDQRNAEFPSMHPLGSTSFAFPTDPAYAEVALYCDLYFRTNQGWENGKGVCHPRGFWLVMFKDGHLEQVDGKDVRVIPANGDGDMTMPVFPGMDEYDPGLPPLHYYEAPWYRPEGKSS